jgi:COP9 signalosome complex subunit 3|eukprot:g2205.t1
MDALITKLMQAEGSGEFAAVLQESKDEVLKIACVDFQPDSVFEMLGYANHPWSCAVLLAFGCNGIVCDSNTPADPSVKVMSPESLFGHAGGFLCEAGEEKLLSAPKLVARICRGLTDAAIQCGKPMEALKPLRRVFDVFAKHFPGCLLPTHTAITKVCLRALAFDAVLPVLDIFVYDVEPKKTGLTTEDMLLYFYYGGMVYGGAGRYRKSAEFFMLCATTPSDEISAIALEAMKKYQLVSLLDKGVVKEGPSSKRKLGKLASLAKPYVAFSTAYQKCETTTMAELATAHEAVYRADGNYDLVTLCLGKFPRQQIQKLTNTYLTLSLDDISKIPELNLTDEKAAEVVVKDMIEKKEIFASIDAQSGMVTFLEDDQAEERQDEKLKGIMKKSKELSENIARLNREVSLSTQYMVTIPSQKKSGGAETSTNPIDRDGANSMRDNEAKT